MASTDTPVSFLSNFESRPRRSEAAGRSKSSAYVFVSQGRRLLDSTQYGNQSSKSFHSYFAVMVYRNKPSLVKTGRSSSSSSVTRKALLADLRNCISARRLFLKQKNTMAEGFSVSRSFSVCRSKGKAGSK